MFPKIHYKFTFHLLDSQKTQKKKVATHAKSDDELRAKWLAFEENKLFDVKSEIEIKMLQKVRSGHCFDEAFYEDQKWDQQQVMAWTKTNEFMKEEKRHKAKQAIQATWEYSAYSESMNDVTEDCSADDSTTETENTMEETITEDEMEIEISLSINYKTKTWRNDKQTGKNDTKNADTQTGAFELNTKSPSMHEWKTNQAKTSKFIGEGQNIAKPDPKFPNHNGNSCRWSWDGSWWMHWDHRPWAQGSLSKSQCEKLNEIIKEQKKIR